MRDLRELDRYRDNSPRIVEFFEGNAGGSKAGAFDFHSPVDSRPMFVIATVGAGWDHVSVSLRDRAPVWQEMEFVKRMFFKEDETAMQLHVPPSDHINYHPYCLHLWAPHPPSYIPRPPAKLVGAP